MNKHMPTIPVRFHLDAETVQRAKRTWVSRHELYLAAGYTDSVVQTLQHHAKEENRVVLRRLRDGRLFYWLRPAHPGEVAGTLIKVAAVVVALIAAPALGKEVTPPYPPLREATASEIVAAPPIHIEAHPRWAPSPPLREPTAAEIVRPRELQPRWNPPFPPEYRLQLRQ